MKIYLLGLLILISCKPNSSNEEKLHTLKKHKLEFSFNGQLYNAYPFIYELNDDNELLAYDHTQGELQLHNLNSKEQKKISLEFAGPNSIDQNIISLFKNKYYFYICTGSSIVQMDMKGKKDKEILFDEILQNLQLSRENKSISLIPKSNWNTQSGDVFLWLKAANSHDSKFTAYDEFIEIVRFNIHQDSYEIIQLPVPENLIQGEESGYYQGVVPHISVRNNLLVYSFKDFDEIFIYNIDKKETEKIKATPNSFNPYPPILYKNYGNVVGNSDETYTRILDIEFDSKNKLIYRLHSQMKNGKFLGNKKLTIVDLEGNSSELDLPEESGTRLMSSQGKFYLIQKDIPDESALRINEYLVIKKN